MCVNLDVPFISLCKSYFVEGSIQDSHTYIYILYILSPIKSTVVYINPFEYGLGFTGLLLIIPQVWSIDQIDKPVEPEIMRNSFEARLS